MRKTIFIVDDDIAILEVLKIILEDNGYNVVSISNGGDVQKRIQNEKPSLILLDIWISGYDGRDIAQSLKRNLETADIPIIVVSAHNDTKRIAKEAGADDFLAKPFDMHELTTMVHKYVNS